LSFGGACSRTTWPIERSSSSARIIATGGIDALAHLDLRHDERHDALPVDPDECIGLETPPRAGAAACCLERDVEADEEGAARNGAGLERRASAGVRRRSRAQRVHDAAPAARLIAWRIRT
jgi:hypothetical protein